MIRSWRFWVLVTLLVGPVAAYATLGMLWLREHGWIYVFGAFSAWVFAGTLFYVLGVRWTKSGDSLLPPIDWNSPRTFVKMDQQAWPLVEAEADRGEDLALERLTQIDTYIDTGKRLAARLAAHYHPLSTDPIEHVPVAHMLTAIELAADDLAALCREVPGGDMVTPAHWKKAVQAAGFFSKANEIYGYLLPLFQPANGLMRLGAQKLVAGPAWKNMQRNALRWFYRAYVNRLGTHLIELYSGRLAIGADRYRKITRKRGGKTAEIEGPGALEIAVVGARDSGRTTLIAALEQARAEGLATLRGRLEADGFDESLADLFAAAHFEETTGYTIHDGGETARDRSTRRHAVKEAAQTDFALLVIDARRDDVTPEVRFAEEWAAYFTKNGTWDVPPLVAVLAGADRPSEEGSNGGPGIAIKARVEAVRKALPPSVLAVVAATSEPGANDRLMAGLAPLLAPAEKVSINRHLRELTGRSKARQLFGQVGKQGKRLFQNLREARKH